MENYQAVYDAVRAAFDISFPVERVQAELCSLAAEYQRSAVLFRPTVSIDGNQWRALYGPNLMEGVCGFGDTPALAMEDFDKNWWKQKPPGAVMESKLEVPDAK